MYLLGFDIGSSSVKAVLVDSKTKLPLRLVQYPDQEFQIASPQEGWAEQDPEIWWEAVCKASLKLIEDTSIDPTQILSIGISYQMHGLVLVDQDQSVIRPSIIWCDGRAVQIGNDAFDELGKEFCLSNFLNSPGNFTASKLKWVKENEPTNYIRGYKMMLPGDFIAMKMSGKIRSTVSGLSEGVFWNFRTGSVAEKLIKLYGLNQDMIPELVRTFSNQGELTKKSAELMGLKPGIPIGYRAGDQPNNAYSLGVIQPGEVAATGGTSGVIYALTDKYIYDPESRVNGFAHINHSNDDPRVGVLLCINGAGILYAWLRNNMTNAGMTYPQMEEMASSVDSDGVIVLPFGNGAERVLQNDNLNAHIMNIQFNRHDKRHIFKAALEGIAFSYAYGFKIMSKMGIELNTLRVGNDNLFQSKVFSQSVANLLNTKIEVRNSTGAIGAARGGGYGAGKYKSLNDTIVDDDIVMVFHPNEDQIQCKKKYQQWNEQLKTLKKI